MGEIFDYLENIFIYNKEAPLLFTQSIFWIFFGFLILIYQAFYKTIRQRNILLLIFSIYFYYLAGGFYFFLIIISTLIDFFVGKKIYSSITISSKKNWLILSLIANLGLLGYFKYTYFFIETINNILPIEIEKQDYLSCFFNTLFSTKLDTRSIFLPIGISFYTFQTLSYSIDLYRGKIKPIKKLIDFALYVSFFPQLIAGPIVRASQFIPQLYIKFYLSKEEFERAVWLIIVGLIKKLIISDYTSVNFVDRVFNSPLQYSGFESLMAVYGYTIQIYCDFSGYTDIAIGLALLLGFRLPINFNSPYKAKSITDFWRRWHISLSTWLRDYLYISMGGNRKRKFKTYLFLMITMLLGGLWHGASIRFIIWGGLHGLALMLHKIWLEKKSSIIRFEMPNLLAQIITFHFVAFCWIFFRANTFEIAFDIINQILTNFSLSKIPIIIGSYWKIFSLIILGYIFHILPKQLKKDSFHLFSNLSLFSKAIAIAFLVLIIFQIKTSEIQPFIYFQF